MMAFAFVGLKMCVFFFYIAYESRCFFALINAFDLEKRLKKNFFCSHFFKDLSLYNEFF